MMSTRVNYDYSYSSLASLNNLNRISGALTSSLERAQTGYKINRPSDNPSGFVESVKITNQISSNQTAVDNNQATLNKFSKVSNYQQAILENLKGIKSELTGILNELSPTVKNASLAKVSSLMENIDMYANTAKIGDKSVLSGAGKIGLGSSASTLLDTNVTDVRRISQGQSVYMNFQGANAAEQAYINQAYTTPTAGNDSTIKITTADGTATAVINAGDDIATATASLNEALEKIGGSAKVNGGNIVASTDKYGKDQSIKFETLNGDNIFGAATVEDTAGVDGSVIINGKSYDLKDDLEVQFSSSLISAKFAFDASKVAVNPTTGAAPANASISMAPEGGVYVYTGTGETNSPYEAGHYGFQDLTSASLGIEDILNNSSASYMLSDPEAALKLVDKAIDNTLDASASTGVVIADTLKANINHLNSVTEELYSYKETIMNSSQAEEAVNIAKMQILQQANASAITSGINSQKTMLNLLTSSMGA
jgi:flagellin-like hook-associated protein FlgL